MSMLNNPDQAIKIHAHISLFVSSQFTLNDGSVSPKGVGVTSKGNISYIEIYSFSIEVILKRELSVFAM